MKRTLLLLAVTFAVAPGCGTIFFHNPQTIRVTSNVPGSLVIDKNEAILGRTQGLSGNFPLDRSRDHMLLVSAEGNEAATVLVESHWSWWRILISLSGDAFLGLLPVPPILWGVVAIIPDVGSGAWQVLDDDVTVSLKPRPELESGTDYTTPPSTEKPSTRGCPFCSAEVDATAPFCPQCGARLEGVVVKPCPICGEPRVVGPAVCPHCGLK